MPEYSTAKEMFAKRNRLKHHRYFFEQEKQKKVAFLPQVTY